MTRAAILDVCTRTRSLLITISPHLSRAAWSAVRPRLTTSSGGRRGLATVYLGLGSNVGDRHANLLKAYKGLREV